MLVAVITGIALELGVHALSGKREAWDSAEYWIIGMPIAALVSVAIGLFSQRFDWLWTIAIVPSQMLTMMVKSGEVGNLWPLALIFGGILSSPFVGLSFVGSRFRRGLGGASGTPDPQDAG